MPLRSTLVGSALSLSPAAAPAPTARAPPAPPHAIEDESVGSATAPPSSDERNVPWHNRIASLNVA